MVLLVCVDNRYGMLFNRRRQSSDRIVTEKILQLASSKTLRMNNYSRDLFPEYAPICVSEDFLTTAEADDYCFVENCDVEPFLHRTERLILFRWNRNYPADLLFPKDALCRDWNLEHTLDLAGNSHEKITMEVYSR